MPREDVEVAAARGDDNGAVEGVAEQHGGDAVRVEVMRVDQIEIAALADLMPQQRQGRTEESKRRYAHPEFRQYGIAWMIDMQPLAGLLTRDPGKLGIPAEPSRPERKPWTGRHDAGGNGAVLDQLPQARLDKNPVLGLDRARI